MANLSQCDGSPSFATSTRFLMCEFVAPLGSISYTNFGIEHSPGQFLGRRKIALTVYQSPLLIAIRERAPAAGRPKMLRSAHHLIFKVVDHGNSVCHTFYSCRDTSKHGNIGFQRGYERVQQRVKARNSRVTSFLVLLCDIGDVPIQRKVSCPCVRSMWSLRI